MSKLAVATEAVKEAVVGTHEPEQLAAHTKARFIQYAVKDSETGELYLGPEEFINAVAPTGEDYVSHLLLFPAVLPLGMAIHWDLTDNDQTAQNLTRPILHSLQRRRRQRKGQSESR